jgi:hypothetical protein
MKKQAYTMIAMIVLVGSMAVAAKAQTSGRTQLIANIPFQFNVGNKTLPAGEYTVAQVNPASDHAVLQLRSKNGRASAIVQMGSVIGKAQESAKLIFNRYGNQYFFAQAWVDGDNTGFEAPKSRAERAGKREIAGIKAKTEAVALTVR